MPGSSGCARITEATWAAPAAAGWPGGAGVRRRGAGRRARRSVFARPVPACRRRRNAPAGAGAPGAGLVARDAAHDALWPAGPVRAVRLVFQHRAGLVPRSTCRSARFAGACSPPPPCSCGALYGLAWTRLRRREPRPGLIAAFTCAVVAWAWIELSFYLRFGHRPPSPSGVATRMRRMAAFRPRAAERACITRSPSWRSCGVVGGAHLARRPTSIGLWTLVVLWWMHESRHGSTCFLGVRNLNEDRSCPEHLCLPARFPRPGKPMNLLFPVSVDGLSTQ